MISPTLMTTNDSAYAAGNSYAARVDAAYTALVIAMYAADDAYYAARDAARATRDAAKIAAHAAYVAAVDAA